MIEIIVSTIAVILSVIAIGVTVTTWKLTRPIEKKQYDSSSMQFVFSLLSDPNLLCGKENISHAYWDCKDKKKPVHFDENSSKKSAFRIRERYDQVCSLYVNELLDKDFLRLIYGSSVVRFYKILEEDISRLRIINPDISTSFQQVADEFITKHKISVPPYRPT